MLPLGLTRLYCGLNTLSNTSQVALVYLAHWKSITLFLYIIRWQDIHTKSGPYCTLDKKSAIAVSNETLDARLDAIAFLFRILWTSLVLSLSLALLLALSMFLRTAFCC